MSNETRTRVLTAFGGVLLLMIFLIPGGHLGTSIVTAVLTAGISWELSKVFFTLSDAKEKQKILLGTAWLIVFINMIFPNSSMECLLAAFIFLFTYFLVSAERHEHELKSHFNEFIYIIFILIYAVLFMSFLPLLRRGNAGIHWLMIFLLMNWVGDSAAYFAGRKYGKTKLYPLISPKKTIEGAIGGLVGTVVVAILYKLIFFRTLGFFPTLLIGVLIGVFSQIGDLCESFLKRAYSIKDSGQILPGHGGFLDRFDGVLFTMPIMYLCVRIFS